MRILIVISTGGSVISELLKYNIIKDNIYAIVLDRNCNAIKVAVDNNINYVLFEENNNLSFSDFVLEYAIKNDISYIYSFYLRLFKGELLNAYKYKLINFHPSLLPAFSGFNPIKNAINFGAKITGTTIHFIDDTIDNGLPILQSVLPINNNMSVNELTHMLFIHQCRSILQLTKWLIDDKLKIINNKCEIIGSKYDLSEFYPNLEYIEAIKFDKPFN
jgi:phosphoribosylglycinamide formyltransferase-1